MNNFEKLYPKKKTYQYSSEHCFDITGAGFEQIINNDFIQLEAECLNDVNYFPRESNKFGIVFVQFL